MNWRPLTVLAARPSCQTSSQARSKCRPRFDTLEDRTAPAVGLSEGFVSTPITADLSWPTAMEIAPDGRIFVTEKGGSLRVIEDDNLLADPFVTLSVDTAGEKGLLGVAFDPDFASNHFVYVCYTTPATTSPALGAHTRISRFDASGNTASGGEQVLVNLDPFLGNNHIAGAIHFGGDGKLYVAVGDNGFNEQAQELDSYLGKILRYNPDGTIPADNPTAFAGISGTTSGDYQAIYAVGFRNPFTFAVKPGASTIYINDVGDRSFEEIDALAPGANYGWPIAEGPSDNPDFTNPVLAYPHVRGTSGGRCIAGGAFYDPASPSFPPEFAGQYFYADYINCWINAIDAHGNVTTLATGVANPVDLKVDSAGNLLMLSIFGELSSISYAATQRQQFITASYRDVLGRTPSLAELNNWTAVIDSAGLGAAINGIVRSDESLGRIIDGMYSSMLGRAADPGGRASHIRFLAETGSIELTLAHFAASDEFVARGRSLFHTGDSNIGFVRALYGTFLNRTPALEEVDFWLGRFGEFGRDGIALNFVNSAEFRAGAIAGLYGPAPPPPFLVTLLKRPSAPGDEEIRGWVFSGLDLLSIEQAFLGSQEYFFGA